MSEFYRHFLIALSLVVLTSSIASANTLEKLFVLHRHGARTGQGLIDDGMSVNCDYPFCQLTNVGKAQCAAVGRYIYSNYAHPLNLTGRYNVKHMQSISTDVSRVVVSGEAFVLGMYNNALPYVDFVPLQLDTKLSYWTSWATWKIRDTYKHDLHKNDAWIVGLLGQKELDWMAEYYNMGLCCRLQPANCILYVNDFLSSNITNGLPVPERLTRLRPTLLKIVAQLFATYLGYKPNDPDDYSKHIGSYGFPLATDMIKLLKKPLTPQADGDPFDYRLYHRAAHDWTLFPFYGSLGSWNYEDDRHNARFVVKFAETIIVEARRQIDGRLTLKTYYGVPEQDYLPDLDYTFTRQELPVRCVGSDGSISWTNKSAEGCDIDDVWRQINTTSPEASDPFCYAKKDYLKEQDCDTNDAPAVGSRCHFYRKHCPAAKCGSVTIGVADPATGYGCKSVDRSSEATLTVVTLVALTCPSLVVGAVIGFFSARRLQKLFRRWCMERTDAEDLSEEERKQLVSESS